MLILAARWRQAEAAALRASHDAGFARGYEARVRDGATAQEPLLRAVSQHRRH